jgi:trehalose-phosphatase
MKYLFDEWGRVAKKINKHGVLLFFDYDGTLTPIVDVPEKAALPAATRRMLLRLSTRPGFRLAIISGRALKDVKKKVGLEGIIYAGNHGVEIEGPGIRRRAMARPQNKAVLDELKKDLNKKLSSIKGVLLEDKGFSLALHYRLVDKTDIRRVKAVFQESVSGYLARGRIRIGKGKMVLEARLPLEWDKGKVVLWLLRREGLRRKGRDILPVYFGDDATDEDAFGALKSNGLTVFVGEPGQTHAKYYLKGPRDVTEFLRRLCRN